jgi:double-stranded uracil-DNA glycosylase
MAAMSAMRLRGFPPAGAERPRLLILGSFPSVASLEKGEYYGHGRNHFWIILGGLLGFDPAAPYAERISRLARAGLALWDVIASCEREGSLDQDIRGEEPNPLAEYLSARADIARIILNGGKAAESFVSHIAPELPRLLRIGEALAWTPRFGGGRVILATRLPSTSPVPTRAYRAARDKLPAWSAVL